MRSMASIAQADRAMPVERPAAQESPWAPANAPTLDAGPVAMYTGSGTQIEHSHGVASLATEHAGPLTQEGHPSNQADTRCIRSIRTYGGQTRYIRHEAR